MHSRFSNNLERLWARPSCDSSASVDGRLFNGAASLFDYSFFSIGEENTVADHGFTDQGGSGSTAEDGELAVMHEEHFGSGVTTLVVVLFYLWRELATPTAIISFVLVASSSYFTTKIYRCVVNSNDA